MKLTCLYCSQTECRCTFCPYCDGRIMPGQAVTALSGELEHLGCAKMRAYDNRLAEGMSGGSKA